MEENGSENGASAKDNGASEEMNEEYLESLNKQRLEYEKEGQFLEADAVYQQILSGRAEMKQKSRELLDERQAREKEDLETNYQEEFRAFNEEWDSKMKEFKEHCASVEKEMKAKHTEEIEKTRKNLEESIPVIPKHSSEYLNLKRIQDTLARNKEYKEAHAVQQKMANLQEIEKLNWNKERTTKIDIQVGIVVKKLENEISTFKQKSLNGLEELKKKRGIEMEKFVKKFQNVKKELELSHKVEINKFEGKHTTGSGIFKSEGSMASRIISSPSRTFRKSYMDN